MKFTLIAICLMGFNQFIMNNKETTQIIITVGKLDFTAEIYNNPTGESLINEMPFTCELKDYAGAEKIFYPKEKLNVSNSPKGYEAKSGDITCYAPWGNVAIFYKDQEYADGLISIGRINNIKELINALVSIENRATFNIKK